MHQCSFKDQSRCRYRWRPALGHRLSGGLLSLLVATGLLSAVAAPAQALIPYVYIPATEEIEAAGKSISGAALRMLQLGQMDDAARLADLAVLLAPDSPQGWLLLAEARLRSNELELAKEALARAKTLDPDNAGVWFAEGSLAMRDEEYKQAEDLIRTGLDLDPDNGNAYFDLGNALLLQGNDRAAMAAFEEAVAKKDDFWEAINNQGLVLYENDKRAAAMERWREAIAVNDEAAEPALALAAALYSEGQQDESTVGMAVKALDLDPAYVDEDFQLSQLWGDKLRASAQLLLADQRLEQAVERARSLFNLQRLEPETQ